MHKHKALNGQHTVGSERRKDAPWPFTSQQQSFKFNTPGFFKKYDFLLRFIFPLITQFSISEFGILHSYTLSLFISI